MQRLRIDAQQGAKPLLRVVAEALVVAGADQQAVEAKGLGAGKGKLTAAQQPVVDPAKAIWKGLA